MVSSLRKFAPRREHKERGQISSRKSLGFLEKHKDYVLRARDYSQKQAQLKRLRERARERNPDEFYFNMEKAQMKDGVHIEERNEVLSPEMLKLMETQDIKYVAAQRDVNRRKIDKLKNSMLVLGQTEEETPRHTVFVDSEEQVKAFDAAEHFNTVPELVGRAYNRPTRDALETKTVVMPMKRDLKKAAKLKEKQLIELRDRLKREEQLRVAETEMNIRRALKEKGQKRKVGRDRNGLAVYKWRAERKK
ncbi:U3 small nucleolar RNA-associated protein 11 [Linderina pennispora]|uniref:U3 small nucleolar RNA-associated protein 11 n=1 Tax=Linderina pennispora TaxID=61395 RepID=A0A1Y1W5V3_9FUNG|nr:U3 small nucleolar RNA-associated protein 11 [Linderina pennispora]ORX68913.1 U3 small nucleolar RNA-associated protein 11 [Linderina pennispora]